MHPDDPRSNYKHRERGPRRFSYTYQDLADAVGLKLSTVRQHHRGSDGKRFEDLARTGDWLYKQRVRGAPEPLTPEEVIERHREFVTERRDKLLPWWLARWPQLDAYPCVAVGCEDLVLGAPGYCQVHADTQLIMLGPHFALRVGEGKYATLHRMMMGLTGDHGYGFAGNHVHHKDFNPWNNRPENLQVLPAKEHVRLHRAVREFGPAVG